MQDVDVCIVGAGPAGSTLSHFLTKAKIDHLLVDKSAFPRDKICGDGLTIDALNVLKRISPELLEKFSQQAQMLPSWGFCFNGPKGQQLRYDFRDSGLKVAPFFTAKRMDLDAFLVAELAAEGSGRFWPETEVIGIDDLGDSFRVQMQQDDKHISVQAKVVIGAEGEKPIVTRFLGLEHFREKENLMAAIRVYYKNVEGFHPGNHLEFFLDRKVIPGYFWTFPLAGNQANVGLAMPSKVIAEGKINLKKRMEEVMQGNPVIKERFKSAEAIESIKGWGLPLMSPKRQIGGDRYALIGDAAGMIEAFTGKGIGPGMMSARILSEHLERAFVSNNLDFRPYHEHMYRYYKNEIKNTYRLQKNLKHSWLLNPIMSIGAWNALSRPVEQRMLRDFLKWL